MTLLQLKYIDAVVHSGSINRAAKELFVSQSGISIAIREVEDEIGVTIFSRTNKGVELTREGRRFYEQILPMLELEKKIRKYYKTGGSPAANRLYVASQHYPFVVKAFVAVLKEIGGRFDMQLKEEASSPEIIESVAAGKSDIGVLFLSNLIEAPLRKLFLRNNLAFSELRQVKPHVYVRKGHPLAQSERIDAAALETYPFVMFARDAAGDGFGEEVALGDFAPSGSIISTNDRYTMYSILAESDAFSIGSGLLTPGYSDPAITSIPIDSPSDMVRLGWIARADAPPSRQAEAFIKQLQLCLNE